MKTITYKFCTKETKTVEVSDEFYATYSEIEKTEQRELRKQTRVEVSLNYCESVGLEFAIDNTDIVNNFIRTSNSEELRKAISQLQPQQQELIKKIFYNKQIITEIAKEYGVSKPAILDRLKKIYNRLAKILTNGA